MDTVDRGRDGGDVSEGDVNEMASSVDSTTRSEIMNRNRII